MLNNGSSAFSPTEEREREERRLFRLELGLKGGRVVWCLLPPIPPHRTAVDAAAARGKVHSLPTARCRCFFLGLPLPLSLPFLSFVHCRRISSSFKSHSTPLLRCRQSRIFCMQVLPVCYAPVALVVVVFERASERAPFPLFAGP